MELDDEAGRRGQRLDLEDTSLEADHVFSDGSATQLATVTGSVASGLTAELTVPVAA